MTTTKTLISQELFDDTLIENEELFDLNQEEALMETIDQFQKSKQSVDHLLLSHPKSTEGQRERLERQRVLHELNVIRRFNQEITMEFSESLEWLFQACNNSVKMEALVIQQNGLESLVSITANIVQNESDMEDEMKVRELLKAFQLLTLLMRKATSSQRDVIKPVLSNPILQFEWKCLSQEEEEIPIAIFTLLQISCKNNESNKRAWTCDRKSLGRLVKVLQETSNEEVALTACNFVIILCRFDDFRQSSGPSIASGHDTVLELSRCGMVFVLKDWLERASSRLSPTLWTTLRVLAVHDDIVQSMVAAGLLEASMQAFIGAEDIDLAISLVGLLRNVSANDDIKTTICFHPNVLPCAIETCRMHADQAQLQEHVCGLFAAMALRKPKNATHILQYGGIDVVITAMSKHVKNAAVQRQGALAIRNLASRSADIEREMMLHQGAQHVLEQAGLTHASCVDEAYAALRDLGCKATKTTIHEDGTTSLGPQMFGDVQSNFRAVYD